MRGEVNNLGMVTKKWIGKSAAKTLSQSKVQRLSASEIVEDCGGASFLDDDIVWTYTETYRAFLIG